MRRALLFMICLVGVVSMGGSLAGCSDGGSTLPDVGPGELKIDASASHTIGYGYLSTSFYVNITGGVQPYTVVWEYGDNSDPEIGMRVSHLYEVAGKYVASCLVLDGATTPAIATDFVEITIFASGI